MDEIRTRDPSTPTDDPGAQGKHALVRALVRIVVGAGVIGFLLARADLEAIGDAIASARPGLIVGALGVMVVGLLVSAYRWDAYLRPLGIPLPPATVVRLYFVGTFFNAFLPTGVGGDAYKAVRIGRERLPEAFASVLLDRISGLFGVAIVGLVGVLVRLVQGDQGVVMGIALFTSIAVIGGTGVLIVYGERLLGAGESASRWRIRERLRRLLVALAEAGRHPDAAVRGLAAGVVFQALVLLFHVLLARALGLDVPVGAMAGVVVIATLATAIPVTINGLGFREGAYVWALGRYAVGHSSALAFGLLVLAVLLVTSAIGGVVYVLRGGEVQSRAGRATRA